MKIRALGAELFHANGQTDRQTALQTDVAKLIVAFRNFTNAPKNHQIRQFELKPKSILLSIDSCYSLFQIG
jgi:hypothetical protein